MDNEYLKRIYGLLESGATLGTGAVSGLVGMPYGLYKGVTSGAYGTPQAPKIAAREAQQFMERNTYQPRTAEGQANLQQLAGLLEASKLPPVMPEASLLAAIPKQAYAAQAERAGMAAEKAIAPVVTRTMERGGLPAQLLGDLSQGSIRPMDVWHGSPHKFDKFDSSKIGTGEGAQVYGQGLYLGEARGTGEQYRKSLSDFDSIVDGSPFNADDISHMAAMSVWQANGDKNKAISTLSEASSNAKRRNVDWSNSLAKQLDEEIKYIKRSKEIPKYEEVSKGYLYKVDLPDDAIAKMVEWETPLSEMDARLSAVVEPLQKQLMNQPNSNLFKNASSVGDVIQYANAVGLNPHKSLKAAGYPGIKYLDEQSRAAGKGTRNFVVFPGNEDLLTIKEINDKPIGGLLGQSKAASALPVGQSGLLQSPKSLTMPDVPTAQQMEKYGRVETVPLSQAVSFQSARDWETFGKKPNGDLIKGYGDKPVALRLETGEYVIYDGNHRTDLAMQAGKSELPMHVIDVRSYDPAHAGRKPAPEKMTDDELLRSLLD